jgi:hypothetical protein
MVLAEGHSTRWPWISLPCSKSVCVLDTALQREQANPAVVIWLGEEHDTLGEAAGISEPVSAEHRVIHKDAP